MVDVGVVRETFFCNRLLQDHSEREKFARCQRGNGGAQFTEHICGAYQRTDGIIVCPLSALRPWSANGATASAPE